MGINGLLPRILPSAGRENYDLRALKDGIVSLTHHEEHQQQPPSKRRRRTQHDTTTSSRGWTRRKVRIAVDVNGWISRAAHGYGGTLMDERHLSYHGRFLLQQQQEQQQLLLEGSGEEKTNDGETNDDVAINNNNIIQQQQQQQEQQQRLEYIQKIVSFTLKRIESMREECSALVLPVLDGNTPPCKLDVVRERSARRKRAVEERDQLVMNNNEEGQDNAESAENEAARTEADVLSKISNSKRGGMGKDYSMRRELLAELLNEFRKRKWPFLVAPYEADGQLAYLANTGAVDVVVTEDSDLIGLGVPTLIYKLGGWNGSNTANRGGSSSSSSSSSHLGTMLHRRDLGSAHDINLLDFSDAMLATMFVAAGCDYCPNLKGIGVVKARNIVKKAFHGGEADSEVALTSLVPRSDEPVLKSVLHALFRECSKDARKELLPLDDPGTAEARMAYERKFLAALAMYRHPLVYDPIRGVHLVANDVSDDSVRQSASVGRPTFSMDEKILMEYEPYRNLVTNRELLYEVIGAPSCPEIAKGIAEGVIDPRRIPNENDDTVIENDGQQVQGGEEEGEISTQPSSQLPSSQGAGTQQSNVGQQGGGEEEGESSTQPSNELLSSQDFSGAGTQQSKFSQSSTSEGLSSPDLLASPSSAVKGLLV